MRGLLSLIILAVLGLVEGSSVDGNRLLIVLEEAAEKAKYSTFWQDLEGEDRLNPIALWDARLTTGTARQGL